MSAGRDNWRTVNDLTAENARLRKEIEDDAAFRRAMGDTIARLREEIALLHAGRAAQAIPATVVCAACGGEVEAEP